MNAPLISESRGTFLLGHAASSQLRWTLVDVAPLLEEMRLARDLSPLAAIGLGQMLSAAAMITRLVAKRPTRLLMEAAGDGPLGTIRAEADTLGHLRGLVSNPLADGEAEEHDTPHLGAGTLKVIRQAENEDNYESKVQLIAGGIARNVANYLETSEQVRSAVLLGAHAVPSGIVAAGGMIVQAMPEASATMLVALEEWLTSRPPVSSVLESGGTTALLESTLGPFQPEQLHDSQLQLSCDCERGRFEAHIRALLEREPDILADDRNLEVQCSFCGAQYVYPTTDFKIPPIN